MTISKTINQTHFKTMKRESIFVLAAIVVSGMALAGCTTSGEEIPEARVSDDTPQLVLETRSEDGSEASYAHRALLIQGGAIAASKQSSDASGLGAFSVEPGEYTVYATAANDESNLIFTGFETSNVASEARIRIADMSSQIPELLVGNSGAVMVGEQGAAASLELRRVVASLEVTVNGLENVDAESITLTVGNMYDQVDLEGNPSQSASAYVSKSLILTKNGEGQFTGNAIVMPTAGDASSLSLTYNVNGTDYTSSPEGRLEANGQYRLETTVETGSLSRVELTSSITYATWNSEVVKLSDSFTVEEPTPAQQWVGPTALPIGGAETYDNFWASSDEGDSEWGETYWTYNLYDGNKTDGSNYWTPASWDRTAPVWYIDLGSAKQGVTIDYWNKAGGAGGQKIRTMDIYVSNNSADYGGSDTEWVKLLTFTSDHTTPTVDAGVQVSTGKIAFSEDGSASYRYVKCVITSKVSNTGETVTDLLDVNVGEVEISTWEFK